MLICSAFSLNMLANLNANISVRPIALQDVKDFAERYGLESAVGHPDTAAVFSSQVGVEVPQNRVTVALKPGDRLVVGQYRGPRLPEGATELPPDATIAWCLVVIRRGLY